MTVYGLFSDEAKLLAATDRLAQTDFTYEVVQHSAESTTPTQPVMLAAQPTTMNPAPLIVDLDRFSLSADSADFLRRQVENGAILLIVDGDDETAIQKIIEDAGGIVAADNA